MKEITQADLDRLINQTHYSWNISVMLGGVIDFLEFSESNLSWQRRREIQRAKREADTTKFAPEDQHLDASYRAHLVEGANPA